MYIFLFLIFIFSIIDFLYCKFFLIILANLLLFWTLIVIFWYSYETLRLRRESQKQNVTSIRPYLNLYWSKSRQKLIIRNIGKGIAVGVSVKLLDYPKDFYYDQAIFHKVLALSSGGGETGNFTDSHRLLSPMSGISYSIEVLFTDMEGNHYRAIFKTNTDYNDKFEIIEQKEGKI